MSMSEHLWNSLEVAKLTVSVLTAMSVAALGWFINRRLKKLEHMQWSNQKLIERRLLLYDDVAPLLNKLLCFYTWIGYWRDISPKQAIDTKRELDKIINIYKHLLGQEFFTQYQSFIGMLFVPYAGPGHTAKIRSVTKGIDGDRTKDCNYEWEKGWSGSFIESGPVESSENVTKQYDMMMDAFKDSIGIPPERPRRNGDDVWDPRTRGKPPTLRRVTARRPGGP